MIFTDHRNLVYIFNPRRRVPSMSKPQADRLERWALFLRCFDYEIFHVAGDSNVWADLLTRWGAVTASHCDANKAQRAGETVKMATLRVHKDRVIVDARHTATRCTQESQEDDTWPTVEHVLAAQQRYITQETAAESQLQRDGEVWRDVRGRVVIPNEAEELKARLMVISHAGAAGHRGQRTTLEAITARYV